MTSGDRLHQPVLLDEVMQCLQPQGDGVYVDCTFGRGGYSQAILEQLDENGTVLALDSDAAAIEYGRKHFAQEQRLILSHGNYEFVMDVIEQHGMASQVKGMVFDLGVSSPQLDDAGRGFSFSHDGPLDMRMDQSHGASAADWLNQAEASEIRRVIKQYGEEQYAAPIVKAIDRARQQHRIEGTAQLADIVYQALPVKERSKRKIHPATKVFQAIRMHINDELGHLQRAMDVVVDRLAVGAVLVVVSFHSLEDRLIKRLFRRLVEGEPLPDRLPVAQADRQQNFAYVARLIQPGAEELARNPRARSARLRAVRRLV